MLEGSKSTFTKSEVTPSLQRQFSDHQDRHTLGSGLFDEMKNYRVDSITVALVYKDGENQWYKTICKIARNVPEPCRRRIAEFFD